MLRRVAKRTTAVRPRIAPKVGIGALRSPTVGIPTLPLASNSTPAVALAGGMHGASTDDILGALLYDLEQGRWYNDGDIYQVFVALRTSMESVPEGATSPADHPSTIVLRRVVDHLLRSSGIDFNGVHGLLFILLKQLALDDVEDLEGTVQIVLQRAMAHDIQATRELSESQSVAHVRLLSMAVARGAADEMRVETSALPADVVLPLLRLGSAEVLSDIVHHQWTMRREERPPLPVASTSVDAAPRLLPVPPSPPSPAYESPSLFIAMVQSLLQNIHFGNEEKFTLLHSAILLLFRTHVMDADGQDVVPLGNETSGVLGAFTGMLIKLSRVYGRAKQGLAFGELHRELLSQAPWARQLLPFRYIMWLVGAQVDQYAHLPEGGNRGAVVSSLWTNVLDGTELALSLFSSPNEINDTWLIASKAARLMSVTDDGDFQHVYRRLMHVNNRFMEFGYFRMMDKHTVQQQNRYFGLALQTGSVDATKLLDEVVVVQRFLRKAVQTHPFWLMDCATATLGYLRSAENDHCYSAELCQQAAGVLLAELQQALDSIGPGFDPLKVASLRRLLGDFGVVRAAESWWKCGCGASNPSDAMQCSACIRGHVRVHWQCPVCHVDHHEDAMQCKGCGRHHPNEHPTVGTVTAMAPAFSCHDCGLHNPGSSIICRKCGKPNPEYKRAGANRIWHCGGCHGYVFSVRNKCIDCKPPIAKSLQHSPECAYFTWKCGCGAQNPAIRKMCHACGQRENLEAGKSKFTCTECGHPSDLTTTAYRQLPNRETVLRINKCTSCDAEHPRDRQVLQRIDLDVSCPCCGAVQKANFSNGAPSCTHCQEQLFNATVSWNCGCGNRVPGGFLCNMCEALAPTIAESAFMWRCVRPAVQADGAEDEQHICGSWNMSWEAQCSECGQARDRQLAVEPPPYRQQHDMDVDEHGLPVNVEIRSRYLPWTCDICETRHSADHVMECPTCHAGVRTPPPCPRCGLAHISLRCPSQTLLELADKLVKELENRQALMAEDEKVGKQHCSEDVLDL